MKGLVRQDVSGIGREWPLGAGCATARTGVSGHWKCPAVRARSAFADSPGRGMSAIGRVWPLWGGCAAGECGVACGGAGVEAGEGVRVERCGGGHLSSPCTRGTPQMGGSCGWCLGVLRAGMHAQECECRAGREAGTGRHGNRLLARQSSERRRGAALLRRQ